MRKVAGALARLAFVLTLALFVQSCGSSGGGGGGGGSGGPLYVSAGIGWNFPTATFTMAAVDVEEPRGTPVDTAVVTVDTIPLPSAGGGSYGVMDNTTFTAFAAGTNVVLIVTQGGYTATATVQMPDQAVITGPTGSTNDATSAIDVTWDAVVPTPTFYQIIVDGTYTASGSTYFAMVGGGATIHAIPPDTLLTGTSGIEVSVAVYIRESDLGPDAHVDSQLGVSNTAVSAPFGTL